MAALFIFLHYRDVEGRSVSIFNRFVTSFLINILYFKYRLYYYIINIMLIGGNHNEREIQKNFIKAFR